MTETKFFSGERQDGWISWVGNYGRIHGWRRKDSLTSAFVQAGPDSRIRAAALIDGEDTPAKKQPIRIKGEMGWMLFDAFAVADQQAARSQT